MILSKIFFTLIFLFITPSFCDTLTYDKELETKSAVVFMYHRFGESIYPSTNIRLDQFQYQLDYLEKNNYNVWPLSRIVRHIIDKKPLPVKTVALTMDDAYLSIFTEAYPRLKKKKFPFTVFVNSNVVDNKFKNIMSWEQMREMKKNGAEFANHSFSHDFMLEKRTESKSMWTKRVIQEVVQAQKRLKDELGEDTNEYPKLFAYPYGEYSTQTSLLIKDLGYINFSQASGPISMDSDLKALPRFAMAESSAHPDSFITKLRTLPLPIYSAFPEEPVVNKENPPLLRIKLKRPVKNMGCYLSSGEAISLNWISPTEVEIYSKKTLNPPRDRYNCTAPANSSRYYWYSHLWIIQE